MSDLGTRLRERKLVQWTVAYLAAAWLGLQLVDVLAPLVGLSLVAQRAVAVAIGFGLLIAIVLAWYHGEQGRQRVSGAELLIIAAVLASAGGALSLLSRGTSEGEGDNPAASRVDGRSLAILPFADLSPEGNQEYFGDGIAEELMSAVARIPGLRVASRTSAFAFKATSLDVREIGRRLGVATVVEGSLRKNADELRIDARIVDVESGFNLWENRFEARAADIFDVQDRIARAVADALEVRLSGSPDELRLLGQTDDHEAQDLYLRGRFAWNRRTRATLEEAVDDFEAALEIDPRYARALVGLGDAYAVLGFYDHRPPAEAFPLARDAARRALEIESRLAEPHATLGYVALYYEWDWEAAERDFRRAIELSPEYATAHQWYANFLVAMGRFDEAGDAMRTASELDPLSMIAHAATGWVYYYGGDYEGAVAQLEESLTRDPDFEPALQWIGQSLSRLGRTDEAARFIERFVDLAGESPPSRAALARLRADQGRVDEARAILDRLGSEGDEGYVPSYEIAIAWAGLDDGDRAVRWLERAYRDRAHSLAFLGVDPQLRSLRGHAGFEDLLRRLGLVDVADRANP